MIKRSVQVRSIPSALAKVVDDLILEVIDQAPTATEEQIVELHHKREQISEAINKSFPRPPLDTLCLYYKIVTGLLLLFSVATAGAILWLGIKDLSVTRHLILGYVCAFCFSWACFYALTKLQRRFPIVSGVLTVVASVCVFALAVSWWLSPYAPIRAQPQVWSADLRFTASGLVLDGKALLPPDERLWVFVGSHDRWRPVQKVAVDFKTGGWNVRVDPDVFRGLGCDVRVAVVAVNLRDDRQLEDYRRSLSGRATSELVPMPDHAKVERVFDFRASANCPPESITPPNQPNIKPKIPIPGPQHEDEGGPVPIDFAPHPPPERVLDMKAQLGKALEVLKIRPGDQSAYRDIAYAQSELGNQDAAEEALSHVALGNDADGLNFLGIVHLRKCRLPEAIENFRAAANLSPQGLLRDGISVNIADAQWIFQRPKKTLEYLQNCVQHDPDGETYLRLGSAYLQVTDIEGARRAFTSAKNNAANPEQKKRASDALQAIEGHP